MTENTIHDDANTPFEWASVKTFDEQGRLLTLTEIPVAKDGVCGECHGSGRVILLTSSNHCPHCLGSGKRPLTLNFEVVKTYDCNPADGTEPADPDLAEDPPKPATESNL